MLHWAKRGPCFKGKVTIFPHLQAIPLLNRLAEFHIMVEKVLLGDTTHTDTDRHAVRFPLMITVHSVCQLDRC